MHNQSWKYLYCNKEKQKKKYKQTNKNKNQREILQVSKLAMSKIHPLYLVVKAKGKIDLQVRLNLDLYLRLDLSRLLLTYVSECSPFLLQAFFFIGIHGMFGCNLVIKQMSTCFCSFFINLF